jgi:hypothetical protein
MTIYLATELTAGAATPMDDERIEARWYTRKELAEMIRPARSKTPRRSSVSTRGTAGSHLVQ